MPTDFQTPSDPPVRSTKCSAALARIEKLCAAYIDLNDGETGKDRDDLLDAAWLVIRQVYEIAIVENVKPPNTKLCDAKAQGVTD